VVAVVADHMWAAKQAGRARHRWDDGQWHREHGRRRAGARRGLAQPGVVARTQGQVAEALARRGEKIDAVYQVPFLAHATLEPMNSPSTCGKMAAEV